MKKLQCRKCSMIFLEYFMKPCPECGSTDIRSLRK